MLHRVCLTALLGMLSWSAWAQAPSPVPAGGAPEPAVQVIRIEDDSTRIEELRVRGETRQITVSPKKGGRAYEVMPPDSGRDPSQQAARGASGQRVWRFLTF